MASRMDMVRVRELMVEDAVCVSTADGLDAVLELMMENGLSWLPVIDKEERCVGIVASVDLLGLLQELQDGEPETDPADLTVEDLMSTNVVDVDPEDTVLAAAEAMLRNQVHHLVVLDAEERLTGILSTTDILERLVASAGSATAVDEV